MKKILIFTIAVLVLSFVSCIYEGLCDCWEEPIDKCDCSEESEECGCFLEEFEKVYENSEKLYTENGEIYMAYWDTNTNRPRLNYERLEGGTIDNGRLALVLPTNEDYYPFVNFIAKLDSKTSPGMYTEPSDVEVLLYENPLIIINNKGTYLGDLEYRMIDETKLHKIFYWYFSKDAKINHSTETSECRYNINAKKGWNKVYFYENIANGKTCHTTDLSKAPDGLKWFFSPPVKEKF